MTKTLAVLGATGHQGGSVINNLLADPELSHQYSIRAITRNTASSKAVALSKQRVEVVQANTNDPTSLARAFSGADYLFLVTTPALGPDAMATEMATIKSIADTAVASGVQYIIFSTLPNYSAISGGKYTAVTPFDAKALGEEYIRSLPVKSAFWCGGYFMENWHEQPFLLPKPSARDDGSYVMQRNVPGTVRIPYVAATEDCGKSVNAILAEPEKYAGEVFHAAVATYSLEELAAILSKATGKTVRYEQVSDEEFSEQVPMWQEVFVQIYKFKEGFGGYFGPGTEEKVQWAKERVRGRLTTLEEYLEAYPVVSQ
ncbi:NmrA-like family domain-containing protein 1 [Cyphellophora attinorum]|uniref:NmrA-like family domain-containing protein 1 n=1 Tax=Cyphellophora attinorum TaxID=1664694 RepID=A0A0N1H4K8_9EURO|nr:NmrA-like family domain-containing protein 1 [Phialophora attinorum]KPI36263.1 NmrA-like family domain-containing protein 1 [Phialophora attinorum]